MWELGLFILASSGVVSFTAWKIAERRPVTLPPHEPLFEPLVPEPAVQLERTVDPDPVPVGGYTPRTIRI